MTTTANIRVTSTGVEQLGRQFDRVNRSVGKVGHTGRKVGAGLTRDISGVTRKVGGLRAALLGLGVAAKGRDILKFGDRMGKLQATAKLTTHEALALRDELLALGPAFGVSKDEAAGAAEVFQALGGLLRAGREDFRLLAKVAKGSGAAMADLSAIDSIFIKQGLKHEARIKAFAMLTEQANQANVALEGVARVYGELASLGELQGFRGQRGVQQLGLALQVAGEAFAGRPEESRTAVKALLRDLTANRKKLAKLPGGGVKVFDKNQQMRDLDVIMAEVIKKTGGKAPALAKLFTSESMAVAGAWSSALKKDQVGKIKQASSAAGMGTIESAYRARIEGVGASFEQLQRTTGELDEILQKYGSTIIGFLAADPKKTLAVAGGGYAAIKLLPALARLAMGGWGGKVGGGVGGAVGAATGVQPVFVVNMPGATPWQAYGYGLGPGGPAGAGGPGKVSRVARVGRGVAGAGGALAAGFGIGTMIDQIVKEVTGKALSDSLAEAFDVGGKVMGFNPYSHKGRMGKSAATAGLDSQAASLARAFRAGAKTVEWQGKRVALTPENIAKILSATGAGAGLKGEELARAVAAAMAENPIKVVVETKGGLDRGDVQVGRGRPQR